MLDQEEKQHARAGTARRAGGGDVRRIGAWPRDAGLNLSRLGVQRTCGTFPKTRGAHDLAETLLPQ